MFLNIPDTLTAIYSSFPRGVLCTLRELFERQFCFLLDPVNKASNNICEGL